MAKQQQSADNKPVKSFRVGVLQCSIWKRETDDDRTFYNTTVSRSFKRKDSEEWEYTDNFSRDDLPVIAQLLNWAFAWIVRQESEDK